MPEAGAEIYGADPFESLRRVLEAASRMREPPERVIATGDLAEDASPRSYERLRELLLATGLPTHVIPGNHDSLAGMRSSLVGGAIEMGHVVDLADWRLVLLDSQIAGRSEGRLARDQLQLLERSLRETPSRPALVALHHSPTRPCPYPGCHLENEADFLRRLAAHDNARVVIAGHSHTPIERCEQGVALLTTPSTCSQGWHAQAGESEDPDDFWACHRMDGSRHGFRMLSLAADGSFESELHWLRDE